MDTRTKEEINVSKDYVSKNSATLFSHANSDFIFSLDDLSRPNVNGLLENEQKLTRFYFHADYGVKLNEVYMTPKAGGCMCHTDYWNHLLERIDYYEKVRYLEYHVPEELQVQFFQLYQTTHMEIQNNGPYCFCSTVDFRPCNILKFEYCVGYWEFSKNCEQNIIRGHFNKYSDEDKKAYLEELHLSQSNDAVSPRRCAIL